jgi:protein tyrosine phosphatase (PTP) superfamily phosphohydrolase (DUF442 family)
MNSKKQNIKNIRDYLLLSDRICTSGQPTEEQFKFIKNSGYHVIINLAILTSPEALSYEESIVKDYGLDYYHIPVIWDSPLIENLLRFFEAMKLFSDKKIFIHCIANKRVSAFMFLYRICYENFDTDLALTDLNKIWLPNEIWQNFIHSALKHFGK